MWRVSVALGAVGLAVPTALAAAAPSADTRTAAPAARVRHVPVVAVAGDIATDDSSDRTTARVVRYLRPDRVLTVGDHTYPYGSKRYFYAYYERTWGDFKARTRPAPGNHEYSSGAGSPPYYYTYFARRLPDRHRGRYYAFNLGRRWRLYSLNCEIACGSGSAQARWLRNDLASWRGRHKLAYLHRPRYSCGSHGSDTRPDALWDRLIAARTDVVLAGHDHNYQRYPRMNSDGAYSSRGPVSFVVGTGGAHLYSIDGDERQQGCSKAQYMQSRKHGVLRLRLGRYRFGWRFVAGDRTVMDSGFRRTLRR